MYKRTRQSEDNRIAQAFTTGFHVDSFTANPCRDRLSRCARGTPCRAFLSSRGVCRGARSNTCAWFSPSSGRTGISCGQINMLLIRNQCRLVTYAMPFYTLIDTRFHSWLITVCVWFQLAPLVGGLLDFTMRRASSSWEASAWDVPHADFEAAFGGLDIEDKDDDWESLSTQHAGTKRSPKRTRCVHIGCLCCSSWLCGPCEGHCV